MGNAFPHNYSDVDDDQRGAMFLEWGGEPQYVNWEECPKYKAIMLSELLDSHQDLLDEYTYARVKLNISISYEEANFIKEQFMPMYELRELSLMPGASSEEHAQDFEGEVNFESVDSIVTSHLTQLESRKVKKT